MNKKIIAIIVGTLAILAIVLISIFGAGIESGDTHKNVIKIEILTPGIEPTTYLDENNTLITTLIMESGTNEYQIAWNVLPVDATDKSVTFTSNNIAYATVDTLGKVTFLQEESVQVTVTSVDDTTKKTIVNFVFPAPTESYLNVEMSETNVDIALQTDANVLHSYSNDQLVLLEGATYTFGLGEDISLSLPEETSASIDENVIETNQQEEFSLTLTKAVEGTEGIVKNVSVKVIPYVNVFNMGTQYANYLNLMTDFQKTEAEQESEFMDKTVTPYLVGADNEFYFNIYLRRPNDIALTQSEIELVYTVKNLENEDVDLSTIATLNGNNILFNNSAIGNTYTFTVLPKYNEIFNRLPLTYTIEVTNGVNVWTSNQLYEAYKNLSVSQINIQSSILVTPRANQISVVVRDEENEDRLNNYSDLNYNDTLRENSGTLFPRFVPSTYTGINEITVNGNYFSLDASSVPLYNYDGRDGQAGALSWADDIACVQEGLFQLQDHRSVANRDEENYSISTFNNLILKGNSAKGPIYTEFDGEGQLTSEEEQERITEQGSGMPLIMTRGGRINVNNVIATNSIFTFWSSESKAEINLQYAKSYDVWGGAIYGYGTSEITLTDVEFTRLGGAAIAYEDSSYSDWLNPSYTPEYLALIAPYTADYLDLVLTFNENVVIDNYLTGLEGWFVVNGFNSVVPTLKTSIDSTLNLANKSMIKNNITSTSSEDFNYILQIVSSGGMDRPNDQLNEVDIQYTIRQMIGTDSVSGERIYRETVRKNGFISTHPFTSLSATGGTYLGSVGSYSSIDAFKQLQHTIAMVNGYLTNNTNIKAIYTNFDASIGLGTVIENIYQSLVGYPLSAVPFSTLNSSTQQLVLLGISGYQSADGTIDVNVMANNLLDTYASYDSATAGYIRSQAEASDDTKMGAFAIGLNMDLYKNTMNILEIMPSATYSEAIGRQLALFVEYFDMAE